MTVIVGIDEAGFGPILGPLVVASAAFRIPGGLVSTPLWDVLDPAVSRRPGGRRGPLAIADSKRLHGGSRIQGRLFHLERGVLASLAGSLPAPRSLAELLDRLAPGARDAARRHPWYGSCDCPLPHTVGAGELEAASAALAGRMAATGVELAALRCRPLFEGEFNRRVEASGNKAAVLFGLVAELLGEAVSLAAGEPVVVFADRQGGRKRYLGALQQALPGCFPWVLREDDEWSAYRLDGAPHPVEVHFVVSCEERQLPVALASMTAKYVRELLMELFNAFWRGHLPGLAPTAGYVTDGRRFLAEIGPAMAGLGIPAGEIVRQR